MRVLAVLLVAALLCATGAGRSTNSGTGGPLTLNNGWLAVTLRDGGLGISQISNGSYAVQFGADGWEASISTPKHPAATPLTLSPEACQLQPEAGSSNSTHAVAVFECDREPVPRTEDLFYTVEVAYELAPGTAFVTKYLTVGSSLPYSDEDGQFQVLSVTPWKELVVLGAKGTAGPATARPEFVANANPFNTAAGEIAAFVRFPELQRGLFLSVANPFTSYTASDPRRLCNQGTNHVNDDLPGMPLRANESACFELCAARSDCVGYVFLAPGCEAHATPACFLKSSMKPIIQESCSCALSKPFAPRPSPATNTSLTINATYTARMNHTAQSPTRDHHADSGVLGLTALGKYAYPETGLNIGERRAFVDCVDHFLLDKAARANATVKINVAWDENDYQIDVGTAAGVTEYHRIIDRNAELGITHIVYEPRNTLRSSRFNSTDGWGWEGSLWFSMGEQIREGMWSPKQDAVPPEIRAMLEYATSKGVKLVAYVYPCLAFQSVPEALIGSTANLANQEFQDWLLSTLSAFMDATGAGGFAWDHNIFAGPAELHYAQWRSWMRILGTLRERHPDMVMDHRQTAHMWGPWYMLAGSYSEPIAGDENPETYGVPIASLHTDHVAGDNTRRINRIYAVEQLLPPARVPGFIFHQTERTDDNGTFPCSGGSKLCYNCNVRDFDLLGYQYSVLSTVGTAGLNNVVTMIPARDEEEFQLFPSKDLAWIRSWLAWTDTNQRYLANTQPIPTLGGPALGGVDGTAAAYEDEAFLFLFNPNLAAMNLTLAVDESIAISNASATLAFDVTELYPGSGQIAAGVPHGSPLPLTMPGSSARVLKVFKASRQRFAGSALHLRTAGPQGGQVSLEASTSAPPPSVLVNGHNCTQAQQPCEARAHADCIVKTRATLQGDPIPRASLQLGGGPGCTPAAVAAGWCNTTLTVTAAMKQQLAQRQQDYPIAWTARDALATWLVPTRLLLYPFIANPQDSMRLSLYVNGAPVPLATSYNSRGLKHSRCFLGFYYDATAFAVGKPYALALALPPNTPAGAFQGIFLQNIEAPQTDRIAACHAAVRCPCPRPSV